MNRILLVDDSPHAQRMGERILSDEGFEVVTVSNADAALVRIEDVDPDVVIADAVMPGRTGYDICQYVKMNPRYRHVRVVLTAGVLEPIDEAHAQQVETDSTIKKPFEATALVSTVRPLAEAAARDRAKLGDGRAAGEEKRPKTPVAPFVAVVDEEQVRAAVTLALDGSMEAIVTEIARRVVATLQSHSPEAAVKPAVVASTASGVASSASTGLPVPAPVPAQTEAPRPEPLKRISPLRTRTSILGLEPEESAGKGPSPESKA
ncbi:MAG TPA: response regulator [Bryobacteraceae bacterium]|jgi:CheY-like chemotaxis protein|nr:response regulator [Bryobacteraceae bacterium]